jgi:hypothetical protein
MRAKRSFGCEARDKALTLLEHKLVKGKCGLVS